MSGTCILLPPDSHPRDSHRNLQFGKSLTKVPVPDKWVRDLQRVFLIVLLTGTCSRGLLNPKAKLVVFLFCFFRFDTSDTDLILSTFTPGVHVSKNRRLPNPSEPPVSFTLKKKYPGQPRWLSGSRRWQPSLSSTLRARLVKA